MAKNRQHKYKSKANSQGKLSTDAGRRGPGRGKRQTWMQTHGRDLRFLVLFGFFMAVYYFCSTTETMKDRFIPWYLELNAQASGAVVHVFGFDTMTIKGNAMVSPGGSISVERGCDALTPCALFVSAVLASPVPLGSRLLAASAGGLLLLVINLLRIISLFLTRVYWMEAFDIMHLEVWQALFIFLAILFWWLWAAWESKRRTARLQIDAQP